MTEENAQELFPSIMPGGYGFFLPETVVKNAEFKYFFGSDDEWIYNNIGPEERRFFHPDWRERFLIVSELEKKLADIADLETALFENVGSHFERYEDISLNDIDALKEYFNAKSHLVQQITELKHDTQKLFGDPLADEPYAVMGAEAARMAINSSGVNPNNITAIICGCMGQDRILPSVSGSIGRILGIDAMNVDLKAACSGFTYALGIADSMMLNSSFKAGKVSREDEVYLLVWTEHNSSLLNLYDRLTAPIFGDGAAALLLHRGSDHKTIFTYADGITRDSYDQSSQNYSRGLWTEYKDWMQRIGMNGKSTFKEAIMSMVRAVKTVNKIYGFERQPDDILIPHQANIRIIEPVGNKLGFSPENTCVGIRKKGNTISASIPLELAEAYHDGRLKAGQIVYTVSYGGGRTFGANRIEIQ